MKGWTMLRRLSATLRRPLLWPAPVAAHKELVRCASSGSVKVTVPLNFWAGKRRASQEKLSKEKVYEPATGKTCINQAAWQSDICVIRPCFKLSLVKTSWGVQKNFS